MLIGTWGLLLYLSTEPVSLSILSFLHSV
ncbi:hypothetical protein HU200_039382 [Digitaria exilis]|uniref:Uncharacterized protein n=1 Tax=Digitaria exilis TaxID=1010633 RepID=A0A835EFP5_9POAL|nr:hypothetical protein HU200_039382 [Digitaria exilis]